MDKIKLLCYFDFNLNIKKMTKKTISYKSSGVDIETGNKLVDNIKQDIKNTNRAGVINNIGGFGALFDLAKCKYKDPLLVAGTDGVGTKLRIAIEAEKFDYIGQDLVAMCVNDLVVQGAEPLFFLDYYACAKLDNKIAQQVIKSIAKACALVNCALIGGETAEMPDMYKKKDFDLAGFSVGAVERSEVLPKTEEIKAGDVIIGIPSSGVHSNGFSLVRKIMSEYQLDYQEMAKFDNSKSYADHFLIPTELYAKPCLELHKNNLVKAFSHITGGGFIENIPRILPKNLSFDINYNKLELTSLFNWLKEKSNLNNKEFYKVFNGGFGMVIIADNNNSSNILKILQEKYNYQKAKILGEVKNV